jgi:hypothetical protein
MSAAVDTSFLPAEAKPAAASSQLVNPQNESNWDKWISAHANHSIFHSASWAKVLEDTYGYAPVYLTARNDGGDRALLPLMEVDSWLTGRRGIALPFTDDCPPLYNENASAKRLISDAFELGKSRRWKTIEFRGGRELFPDAPASISFFGHSLNLSGNEDELFARLESSVRRAIRKSEKSGVTVNAEQSLEAIKIFYSLQCQTRRKHGLPPQPFAFFQNIWRQIVSKDLGMIVVARNQNAPVAASVYFQWGAHAIYKFGASDESFQQLRGANLVMWEAIKQMARRGAKKLNLGRTSVGNEGLRRFKLGWGAEEEKIEYVKYDFRRGAFVTEKDETTGWHNHLFRALPLSVSRMAGAVLYRHCA